MKTKQYLQIKKYNKELGRPVKSKPFIPEAIDFYTQFNFIKEELHELVDAYEQETINFDDVRDAFCDIDVTLAGMKALFGYEPKLNDDDLNEVIDANNRKFVNGKPIMVDGKQVKPAGWYPPKFKDISI